MADIDRKEAEVKYRLGCWLIENLRENKVITRSEASKIRAELLTFYNPLTKCLGSERVDG